MTLSQLSVQYDASAALVAGGWRSCAWPCVPPAIRRRPGRLRRRIAELRPMLEQCRRLTQLTARYYDRSFCGYGEYRI